MSRRKVHSDQVLQMFLDSGVFRIDPHGRIWRGNRRADRKVGTGYLQVRIMINAKRYTVCAHRLVYRSFFGSLAPEFEINHKNGIKDDNRPCNLEVCTTKENIKHAYRSGLRNEYGERNPAHCLTDAEIVQIRLAYSSGDFTQQQLAKRFGVAHQHISRVIRGQRRPRQDGPISDDDHRHSACDRDDRTGRFVGKTHSEIPHSKED